MIRLQCPGCDKMLGIPDNLAGRLVACPQCKNKFRVPEQEAAEPDEEAEVQVTARPRPSRPAPAAKPRPPAEDDEEPPARRPRRAAAKEEEDDLEEAAPPPRRRPAEDDLEEAVSRPRRRAAEEEEEKEPPRRRRKRKKKRRPKPSTSVGGMDPMLMAGIGVGGICLLVGLGALLLPWLAVIPICVGLLLAFVGGIWFLIVAFQDDVIQGILVWFVPFYALYYLFVNWEGEKKPFLTQMVGCALMMFGSCVGGIGGAIHEQRPPGHGGLPATWAVVGRSAPG